ncbi:K(+)-stimulated pyrophosphate-energized sodium pump [Symbiobacterium terraclitae]|uniref:Putative K(+)-stimulated pyrophosphate-energized sodium pump n=2 Tax=Symbiobacterium terraclitae TaxID=557451 RepID=A0ABS4JUY0_9FIRM|nr:K(+)-stimulated pyrophosphate-energized sodium pump [Symbiobacterium terraclitae]
MNMASLAWTAPVAGALALLTAYLLASKINRQDPGTPRMREIAAAIHDGAMAFLNREYRTLVYFVLALAAIIVIAGFTTDAMQWQTAIAFVTGAVCSILAGNFGMRVATQANVRTANAAQHGLNKALDIAFSGGAVMGLSVVGLGMLGVGIIYMIFGNPDIVNGFALGASSIALFARVGGGIYTKAADVGADLVGKVEAGIPEDDPRNPAVIADNVGDNVGDVAGMGADLFESYVGATIAAMAIAVVNEDIDPNLAALPLLISAGGIVASIIGTQFVKGKEGANPAKALNMGTYAAGIVTLVIAGLISFLGYGTHIYFTAVVAGLVAGILIGQLTEYYTSGDYGPVKSIADASETGPATNIIAGLGVGMMSTGLPILVIGIATLVAYAVGAGSGQGLFTIALAAVGMLSTTGMTVAVDAYGPIADNAGGIAEMSHLDPKVRKTTDTLDSVGNTTAAIGKGFAIGSAALTALSLFGAFATASGLGNVSMTDPKLIVGLFIGGMLPFLFGAMTMNAVGRAAMQMVEEVRRQFREIKGIMEEKAKPDYARCVEISTGAALKEMVVPGLMAVAAPLAVGWLLGVTALAGLLAGALVTGVMMAIMMANSGGAWDNAKKYIEGGAHGGKGSQPHKAAVVGDTVGDPFKDTSGPSMNILIKLMTIVSLVFAATFGNGLLPL